MDVAISDIILIIRLCFDILVVWLLLYTTFRIVRNNERTVQIVKGALLMVILKGLAAFFGFSALSYILDLFLNWGIVLIIVIFQPEIRAMLERVGKSSSIMNLNISEDAVRSMIDEIVTACRAMSKSKTGALITIQGNQSLDDYVRTGIRMDSEVSSELLGTIFQYGTPMHDGAVIIQGNKIACAAAYFPPTSQDLASKYGARHRAAVGISEISDSITIVVSEETGNISVAMRGRLTQYKPDGLDRLLTNLLMAAAEKENNSAFFLEPMINSTVKYFNRSKSKSETETRKNQDERVTPIEIVDLSSRKQEVR